MNGPSNPSAGPRKVILAGLLVVLCGYGIWEIRRGSLETSARLHRDIVALRSQLDARDEVIQDLKASIRQLQTVAGAKPPTRTTTTPITRPAEGDFEWAERLHDIEVRQSNTVAMVERLMERMPEAEDLELVAGQLEALMAREESMVADQNDQAEAARQRAADLLLSLAVPVDIADLDPVKALENPALQNYWPYFEARRESEALGALTLRSRAGAAADRSRRSRQRSNKP